MNEFSNGYSFFFDFDFVLRLAGNDENLRISVRHRIKFINLK